MNNIVWMPLEDGEYDSFVYVDNGGKLLGVFAGDDYTDWYATHDLPDDIRLCRAMPAPAPAPAPFDVEVQPPSSVRDMLALEADIPTDNVRYVVYNDAQRGEWLHKLPALLEMPSNIYWAIASALTLARDGEEIDPLRRSYSEALAWLDAQRTEEARE